MTCSVCVNRGNDLSFLKYPRCCVTTVFMDCVGINSFGFSINDKVMVINRGKKHILNMIKWRWDEKFWIARVKATKRRNEYI